jgi:hypothetical protein
MKKIRNKGAKYMTTPHAGKPDRHDLQGLNKGTHSLNDYAKLTPLNMTAANMPVAQVSQFAAKGLK